MLEARILSAGSSTRRVKDAEVRDEAERIAASLGLAGPVTRRTSLQSPNTTGSYQQRMRSRTTEDDEIDSYVPPRRTTGGRRGTSSGPPPEVRKEIHPLVWVGLTLFALVIAWIATTSGLAWWATHMSDPGQYGKLQGSVISAVVGGGDSPGSPTQLIGWNNHGHVLIIKVAGNDPSKAQIMTGPDLSKIDFPDPQAAVVDMKVSDVDGDGKADLTVTIYADLYDLPFHRYRQVYVLYGDGKGNFAAR